MVKVSGDDRANSFTISKKLGWPWGFGKIWFGVSRFGDDFPLNGIYQRRPTKTGQIFVRENFYWPIDTITAEREAVRLNFANGVSAWQALTDEEKEEYRARQYPLHMSGYNRFLSLWLKGLI